MSQDICRYLWVSAWAWAWSVLVEPVGQLLSIEIVVPQLPIGSRGQPVQDSVDSLDGSLRKRPPAPTAAAIPAEAGPCGLTRPAACRRRSPRRPANEYAVLSGAGRGGAVRFLTPVD